MKDQANSLERTRTEEVQSIIERMPTNFGFFITSILITLFLLLITFGWVIKYPEIVTGQIVINSSAAPLKLIANTSGKLKLLQFESKSKIREGDIIAYIDNAASLDDVITISKLIRNYHPTEQNSSALYMKLPTEISLGELNSKYYSFKNALQETINYHEDNLMGSQKENLNSLLTEQKSAISGAKLKAEMAYKTLMFTYKFYKRDSLLFTKKVMSEAELDKSQLNYIAANDTYQSSLNNLSNSKQAAQQTFSRMQDLSIQDPEKKNEVNRSLIASYNDLIDNIKAWEEKYVFKAPFEGKIQFLKFFKDGEYVQSGEAIFSAIPNQELIHGELLLPAKGSGKITEGQDVIVKLDNYPYLEYGIIKGQVSSISLVTNKMQDEMKDIDAFMILINFPHQLKTNYGSTLDVKINAKGTAEIITNDRRLIERLFDNLKYAIHR